MRYWTNNFGNKRDSMENIEVRGARTHNLKDISLTIPRDKLIVITRGSNGAIAISGNEIFECEAKNNLKIIDLTGAGDLFAAGFLHGVINKNSIKESLEKGTQMSSDIIQKIGARS